MNTMMGLIAGMFTAYMLFKVLFNGVEEFKECVRYWLTPDIISMFQGNYWEDHWAELKLIIWLGSSTWVGYGVYSLF